jgi:ABC-2 type transport system ATP-binding protein
MNGAVTLPIVGRDICKTFRLGTGEVVRALDGVSLEARHGALTALVGPDGAGKTTLIRLVAGLFTPDAGALNVLDIDVVAQPQAVQDRIGYMPQKFGLYENLSVQENLDLYADLHGIGAAERQRQYPRLLEMTALAPFTRRLAGQLSGGMKQKLGLACTLVRSPELVLLDEPTVGVDPLSRRELWDIILRLVKDESLTVLLSTSYLDEAERCGHVIVLHSGRVLAQGTPEEITATAGELAFVADPPAGYTARGLQARLLGEPGVIDAVPEAGRVRFVRAAKTGADLPIALLADAKVESVPPRFEDAFMVLLRRAVGDRPTSNMKFGQPSNQRTDKLAVEVRDLVRRFGNFIAVDHVSFQVRRGGTFRVVGTEWSRQDNDVPDALRIAAGHQRHVASGGSRSPECAGVGAAAYRICGAAILALRPTLG